ncbi:MAG TPA: hypothetical protein VGZ27_18585 [Vicinamibacterales bacterium]|jgi:hypothetical protein|nr:hypothetical protein [Vicinamibacterales bacterium]
MLTRRHFALTAAIFLSALIAMSAALGFLARNSVPRRVMRHARTSQSASVLVLGNSVVEAGFDEPAFDAAASLPPNHGAANIGLGASAPVEQLLLLRYALAHGMHPRLVVYGFFDFQLTEPSRFSTRDLIGNHAMLYYVEPFYARRFYSLSLHDAIQFRAMRSVAMWVERGAVWQKVEILRRHAAEQGMPAERSNRFGRTSDFLLLEADSTAAFQHQCEVALDLPLAPAVGELFRQAHDADVNIAVVEMPMRAQHRQRFYDTASWPPYVAHVRSLLSRYGVAYVDASNWIDDDSLFFDPMHLSHQGAVEFSRKLGSVLAQGDAMR